MSNASYCRFRNTLEDLRDCYDNWEVHNEEEKKAQKRLLELCHKIIEDYEE